MKVFQIIEADLKHVSTFWMMVLHLKGITALLIDQENQLSIIQDQQTYACILKAHSHSMSGGSIWASLDCQCCFWIAGGLVVT
jgi:hypothetical protein